MLQLVVCFMLLLFITTFFHRGFLSGLGEVLIDKRFIISGLRDAGTTSMERAQKHLTEPVTLENCRKGKDLGGCLCSESVSYLCQTHLL